MRERKVIVINTVEEFATFAGSQGEGELKSKWQMESGRDNTMIDPENGNEYHLEPNQDWNAEDSLYSFQSPEGMKITKRESELFRYSATTYFLKKENYSGIVIQLSADLGEKLDAVWTRNPTYPEWRMNNAFTLSSLCKRLGVKGGADQINKAVAAAKEIRMKDERNMQRNREIARLNSMVDDLRGIKGSSNVVKELFALINSITETIEA